MTGAQRPGYPFDCWYVAAASEEVGTQLLPRRVLGTQLLLYRRRSGGVVALQDRCSHRALPLSMGQLLDDEVVCRYHGFTFDGSGRCVLVPSQGHVPFGADVRSFPVREEGHFVWVWLGQASRSGGTAPPPLPWLTDPGWTVFGGSETVAAGFMLLHDNALDRTHFASVHPYTSPRGYLDEPPPLQVEVTETSVSYAREFPPGSLASWQAGVTGLAPDARCAQRESGIFVSPGLHIDHMQIESTDGLFRTVFVRAFTPVDAGSTLVNWRVARDFARDEGTVSEGLRRVHERTMVEDRPLLEAIQATLDREGPVRPVHAAADVASVKAQQIVRRMLDEEAPHGALTNRLP